MATGPSLSFQTHLASITAARDLGLFETCNYFFIDVDSNNIIGKIPMQGFSLGQKKICSSCIYVVSPTVKYLHFLTVIIICRVFFSNFDAIFPIPIPTFL